MQLLLFADVPLVRPGLTLCWRVRAVDLVMKNPTPETKQRENFSIRTKVVAAMPPISTLLVSSSFAASL